MFWRWLLSSSQESLVKHPDTSDLNCKKSRGQRLENTFLEQVFSEKSQVYFLS